MSLSSSDLSSLPSLSHNSFHTALANHDIILTSSTSQRTIRTSSSSQHIIHICPKLGEKPPHPKETPTLDQEPDKDPFDGSWGKGELIARIRVADGKEEYAAVNNMNALAPEHFMIVPSEFRPQASDLLERDLDVGFKVTQAYKKDGRDQFLFFNGGPLAGASQPHLHLQFFPYVNGEPPLPESVAAAFPSSSLTSGKLPLPYIVFYSPLPDNPTSQELFKIYNTLLSQFNDLLDALPPSHLPPSGPKLESYNLILTTSHMFLIPRRKKDILVPSKKEDGERCYVLNGLTFAGYWFVESEEKADELVAFGLARALTEDGYPNSSP